MLLMTIIAITATQAQQKVTLAQCQGDTVAYVKKNFVEGKTRFIGQPFSKAIKEWKSQIPINRIIFGDTGSWPSDENQQHLVTDASLYFTPESVINLRGLRKEPYCVITFTFEPPYRQKFRTLWEIKEQEGVPFGPRLYEQIKDYIVKDVFFLEMK